MIIDRLWLVQVLLIATFLSVESVPGRSHVVAAQPEGKAKTATPDAASAREPFPEIPPYERDQAVRQNSGKFPESLVGILGSSKLKHWAYYISDVAWSPDGSMLGSAGAEGALRLFDPDSGEQLRRFQSLPMWLNGPSHLSSLAFDPQGKHVAAGMLGNAVRIWNVETGAQVQLLKDDGQVLAVDWHPSKPLLATGGELVARIWDLSTGQTVHSLESREKSFRRKSVTDCVHVSFAPDDQDLLVAHPDGSVRYWNVTTGEVTRTIDAHKTAIH